MLQSLGQFLTGPIWGRLSDRFGRKNILMITFALAALAEILTAFATSLIALFITRFFVGLCAGNVAAASAYVADVTTQEDRSKGMAVIGVSFGLGFTIGPAIGALISFLAPETISVWGLGLPFLVAGLLSLFTLILTAFVLREPPLSAEERQNRRGPQPPIREILNHPGMLPMVLMFFAYTMSASVLEATFFLYAADEFSLRAEHIGATFAGLGLLLAILQGSVGRVAKRLGDPAMVLLGIGLCSVGLVLSVSVESLLIFLMFVAIATAGRAYMHPGLLALTSKVSPTPALAGTFLGILQSFGSLGRISGPAIGGWTYEYVSHEAPFIIAGLFLLVCGIVWKITLGRQENQIFDSEVSKKFETS